MSGVPDNHDLAMAINTLSIKVEMLTRLQEAHNLRVDELTVAFQKGKGAVWVLVTLGGLAVAMAAMAYNIRDFFIK